MIQIPIPIAPVPHSVRRPRSQRLHLGVLRVSAIERWLWVKREDPDAVLPHPDRVAAATMESYDCCFAQDGRRRDYIEREELRDAGCIDPDYREVVRAAALLYGAIDHFGYSFNSLVRDADDRVAALVASIATDPRLDERTRHDNMVASIQAAPECGKLIKFAEIRETVWLKRLADVPVSLVGVRNLVGWYNRQVELLEAVDDLAKMPIAADLSELAQDLRSILNDLRPLVDMKAEKRAERAGELNEAARRRRA